MPIVVDSHNAALDATRGHGATTRDRVDIFDPEEERRLYEALGQRDIAIHLVHQPDDGRHTEIVLLTLQGPQSAAADHRERVTRKPVFGEQLTHFQLDEIEQLDIVDHVDLVHEHNHVRHSYLSREQNVLACLGHGTVGGGHDEDRAVHLGSTRDHVFDIVSVSRTVDMRVVTSRRLVLHVSRRDCDAAVALFRRLVDLVEIQGLSAVQLRHHFCERRRQCRFAMVYVTNGSDVEVRFGSLELLFQHDGNLLWIHF
jgi:hypothetical protein